MKFILTLRLTLTGRLTWTRPVKIPVLYLFSFPLVRLRTLFSGDAVKFRLNFLKSLFALLYASPLREVVFLCDLIEFVEVHPSNMWKVT